MGKAIEIYTDGACSGNPGPGGWGVVMCHGGVDRELCGGEPNTTNNRMELTAAIRALESLETQAEVILTTDSQYVRQGITEWVEKWEQRGWRTASKQPVKNVDLWRRLRDVARMHTVDWRWVRGHSGHPGNERADALANKGMAEQKTA